MSRQSLLVLCVLLAGVGVACWVGIGMFDLRPDRSGNGWALAAMILVLGGFPALLAALKPRASLALLIGAAVLLGIWGASVFSLPGDGAIGGFILLLVDAVLVIFGLAVIGLRSLVIKNPAI